MNISLYGAVIGNFDIKQIVRSVPLMNAISHQIEQQILKQQISADLYAGFQRLSFFEPQQNTYRKLDAVCNSVTVFGVADIQPPSFPNTVFTAVDRNSPLAQEWFIVVDTPSFWTLLGTQELLPDARTGERRFEGVWTFDPGIVANAARFLGRALGRPAQRVGRRDEAAQAQNMSEIKTRMKEQSRRQGSPVDTATLEAIVLSGN